MLRPSTRSVIVLDAVSIKLGNTRTVCKKYYVHPGLIQLYEDNKLIKYLNEINALEKSGLADSDSTNLTHEEQVLMRILKKYIMTVRA